MDETNEDNQHYSGYLQDKDKEELSADDLAPSAQEKVLIILKSSADSMRAPEVFLRNRGWTIYSTDKLREALALLIQK